MLNNWKHLIVLGALSLSVAACSQKEDAGKTALKVGHLPVTGHAKFFIAKEEGFFDKEGLDVTLIEFTNSADGLNAIRAGQIDLGAFGTTAPLVHIAKGADIRIIGGVMGNDAAIIVKAEDKDKYQSVADLKGKKIATVRLASGDAVLRGALKKAGLDWKTDVEIFELKSPPAVAEAVKSGQVDAGVTWGPHDQRAPEQGLAVVFRSLDLSPGHPCCRLTITGEELKKNGKIWPKFIRAFLRAEEFAKDPANRQKVVVDIVKYVKLDPALIEKAYYSDNLDQTTDPNVKGVEVFWETMQDSGFIESKEDIAKHIDGSFYLTALKSLAKENPQDEYWQKLLAVYKERD